MMIDNELDQLQQAISTLMLAVGLSLRLAEARRVSSPGSRISTRPPEFIT